MMLSMTNSQNLTSGDKVRVQLPNWDSPGSLVYTVELIISDEAIVREPRVPGLKGETRSFPITQLVIA